MNLDSGRHVAVNIRTKTSHNLDNISHVEQLFHETIAAIQMNALMPPQSHIVAPNAHNVNHPVMDDGGLTTFCIIDTSHIAYHSWPLQRRFRFSVDSCKDYKTSTVLEVLNKYFDIEAISVVESKYAPPIDISPPASTNTVQLHLLEPLINVFETQQKHRINN